jgi:hypothetical protein
MEEYIVDNIRRILLSTKLPLVFCINKRSDHIYDNGINLSRSEIASLQTISGDVNKHEAYHNGIKINGTKFVVIEITEETPGLIFVHAKSQEEGAISLVGRCYTVIIQYNNELVPMYHSMKIDFLKNQLNTINKLLA